jgi:hypothetical protein
MRCLLIAILIGGVKKSRKGDLPTVTPGVPAIVTEITIRPAAPL